MNWSLFPRLSGWACRTLVCAACAATGAVAGTNDLPGLVVRFNMDELRNGAFLDLVTSNATARATNVRVNSNGKLGSACEFAAKSSYVQIPDSPALNPKRLTLSAWFKLGKEAWVTRYIAEKDVKKGYALMVAGGGKESGRKGKLRASVCGHDILSDAAVNDDAWHHAVVTFDGQTLKLYLDSVLQKQTASFSSEPASSGRDFTIGMNRSEPSAQERENAFDGLIDEVSLYNRALDASDIKRLRSQAKPKFTRQQVERRLKELKDLLDRGLILQDFYDRKVEECEVVD